MLRRPHLPALLLGLAFAWLPLYAQDKPQEKPKDKPADAPKSADAPKPATAADSSYFPTKVGTTWTYKIGDKKVIARVARMEKKGKYDCAVLETLVDGNVVGNEHVAVTSDGVYRVAYNGQEAKEPVKILALPPKKDESWEVKTEIAGEAVEGKFKEGEEEITVPESKDKIKTVTTAGDFKINGQDARFAYWFADKKGIVKQQLSVGGSEIMLELEKFEEGK